MYASSTVSAIPKPSTQKLASHWTPMSADKINGLLILIIPTHTVIVISDAVWRSDLMYDKKAERGDLEHQASANVQRLHNAFFCLLNLGVCRQ